MLALALLALFGSFRLAFISLTAMALSMIAATFLLYELGYTFNALVTLGLLLALAVVADDAAGASYSLLARLSQGSQPGRNGSRRPARGLVTSASREFRGPVCAATLAIALSAAPLVFAYGLTANFLRPMVLAFVLALAVSMVLALVLTPALAGVLLAVRPPALRVPALVTHLDWRYASLLARMLRLPRLALPALLVAGLAGLAVLLPFMHPQQPRFQDRNLVIRWSGGPGMSLTEIDRISARATQELLGMHGVQDVAATLGRAVSSDQIVDANAAQIWVTLKPDADYDSTVARVRAIAIGTPGIRGQLNTYETDSMSGVLTGRPVLAASLEVRVAIFYATLINIIAVVPVMLVGGLTGAFFEPLALAYGLAVLASMMVALTVTPALGLILMERAPLKPGDPPLVHVLKLGYRRLLVPVLRAPGWAFLIVPALIVTGLVIYPRIGQDLFPSFKEPDFLVHFVTKPDTSVQEEDRDVTRLQRQLLAIPGVSDVGSHIGTAPLGEEINGVNFSESWLSLAPGADYTRVLSEVRAAANSHPGAYSDVQTYLHERIDEVLTDGTTEDVVVRIYGSSLPELQKLGNEVNAALSPVPGLVDLHPVPLQFIPQVNVQVNLTTAERYGLTPGVVRRAAAVEMASEPMAEISTGGVLYPVAAWSTRATRQNLASLRELPIDTPGGGHVPLSKLASIRIGPSPSQILRENGERYAEVDANVSGRNLGSVTTAVKAALASVKMPAGYHYTLLGEAVERANAQRQLIIYGLAAALAILLLLQVAFGSWRLAALLFLTLPMALVGGVLAAWGGLGTITLGALVGFFTVLGIAARNGILLISHFRHLEDDEGEPFGPGLVLRGASERLSPIMMTALATALALLPLLIYGNRPGQEIEFPMATVILGGLLTSTLLNLFVLPALYLRFGRRRTGPAGAVGPDGNRSNDGGGAPFLVPPARQPAS